jgi:polysaccharide export outer membrane protein
MRIIWKRLILATTAVLVCSPLLAQTTPPQRSACNSTTTGSAPAGFSERDPRYRIQTGDSFEVTFEFVPDFNQAATVQPDGFVTMKGIGDVKVGGQTIPELTTTLCRAYNKIMVNPGIAILLKDFNKPAFVASGQVLHPGKYDLRGDMTLTEAIAVAGGFTEKSKHSQVVLFRRLSDKWSEARVIDVKKMFNSKSLDEDPVLQAGDMFVVPQNRISKISRYLPTPSVSTYVSPASF